MSGRTDTHADTQLQILWRGGQGLRGEGAMGGNTDADGQICWRGQGDGVVGRPGRARILVPGEATSGRFALIALRERRGVGPLRHIHEGEDEFVHVLAGCVAFEVGGAARDAPAGTGLLLPRGVEHAHRVVSGVARLLVVAIPAGIEGYYRELARLAARPDGTTDVERLVTIAARYGIAITGPGLQRRRDPRAPPGTSATPDEEQSNPAK